MTAGLPNSSAHLDQTVSRSGASAPAPWRKPLGVVAAAIGICVAILVCVMQLWRADLRVPFGGCGYNFKIVGDDIYLAGLIAKSLVDNHWYLRNPYLGAPYSMQVYDYPFADSLGAAMTKALTLFSSNYAVVLNVYFLMTFPLAVLTSMFALRQFNVSFPAAIVVSELFAFLPYHFMRGEPHLFLAGYYPIPLAATVMLWLWLGELTPSPRAAGAATVGKQRGRRWFAIAVAALLGSANIYYAFFTGILFCVAGAAAWARTGSPRHFGLAIALSAAIAGALALNNLPGLIYALRNGINRTAVAWPPASVNLYSLRISQLILPVTGHRLSFLAKLKAPFALESVDGINETDTAALGAVGASGFLLLLACAIAGVRREGHELLRALAGLNLAAVMIGVFSGFGVTFAMATGLAMIRCYNRFSIFIAFFSLFAIALLLDAARQRLGRDGLAGLWPWSLAAILCLGILDQTTAQFVPPYEQFAAEDQSDTNFVRGIEQAVPAGAMIFELPQASFPEHSAMRQITDLDLLKGYLHSRALKWSYGAMRGRPESQWAINLGMKPADELVATLAGAGFSGIYIDRLGFADSGATVEPELAALLGEQPIVSQNARLSFFNLAEYAKSLRAKYSPKQWREFQRQALEVPDQNGRQPGAL